MSTVITERPALYPVFSPTVPERPAPATPSDAWRTVLHRSTGVSIGRRKKASRYERFTTQIVVISSALILVMTGGLHLVNLHLETRTSSTSGSHSGFYKD